MTGQKQNVGYVSPCGREGSKDPFPYIKDIM